MSTHNLCFEQKYEKCQNFLSENFPFLVVKFSISLNRRVFVMICDFQGPVLQSIVRLTSLLVVKLLTVLLHTVSNLQVFLLKKKLREKLFTYFQQNISIYAIFNDQNFNDMLTNHIVSFEQLGLVCFPVHQTPSKNAVFFERKEFAPNGIKSFLLE